MRPVAFVMALILLSACPKGDAIVKLKDKWEEVTAAAETSSEAAALEAWVAAARSAHVIYTLTIVDGSSKTVPLSEWEQRPGQKLTVVLRLEKGDEVLRWVPVERGNIAILLRE